MKVDDDTLRDALKTLDTPVLRRLHKAMYEVCGASEMDIVIQILRSRHGAPSPWERMEHSGGYTYVQFCSKASGPDDPEHQRMDIHMPDGDGPHDFGCTCGLRMFDNNIKRRMKFAALRDNSDPKVWPVVTIRVGVQLIPHFAICGRAKAPFDPGHAPPSRDYEERCICGEHFKNSLYALEEHLPEGFHVDCTGQPDGCKLAATDDLEGPHFYGKLFPLY